MTKYIFLTVLALTFLNGLQSAADVLRLDKSVSLPSVKLNGNTLTAFQSNTNCRVWNYIPGYLATSGTFMHSTDITAAKVGDQKLVAYVSALEFMAGPSITQDDVSRLQSQIYNSVKGDAQCVGQVSSRDDIVLSPALVQSIPNTTATPDEEGNLNFSKVFPTYGMGQPDAYRDPINPMSITYMTDASNPHTAKRLKDLEQSSQIKPIEIGKMLYALQGVTAQVDSHLRYKGTMTAQFQSDIQKTHCTVHSGSKSLSVIGAAAGVAGAGMGFGDLGYSETSTTCDFNLITQFKGGSYKGVFEMDQSHSKTDVDQKPIMYVTCNEKGSCTTLPLADFIELRLYTELLLTNFDIIIRQLTSDTYDITLGRTGDVKTSIDVDIGYLRNFNGKMAIMVPIFAENLDASSFDFTWLTDPFYACANRSYVSQAALYHDFIRTSPVPVATTCLQTNN